MNTTIENKSKARHSSLNKTGLLAFFALIAAGIVLLAALYISRPQAPAEPAVDPAVAAQSLREQRAGEWTAGSAVVVGAAEALQDQRRGEWMAGGNPSQSDCGKLSDQSQVARCMGVK